MWTWRQPYQPKREACSRPCPHSPQKGPALPAPRPWTSSLQNCEATTLLSSHAGYGHLLWQRKQRTTSLDLRMTRGRSWWAEGRVGRKASQWEGSEGQAERGPLSHLRKENCLAPRRESVFLCSGEVSLELPKPGQVSPRVPGNNQTAGFLYW